MEAGIADFVLDNTNRYFDPTNADSPYYGYLDPLNKIQLSCQFDGGTYYIFTGFVENWQQIWEGPDWAEINVTASDAFEVLSQGQLVSPVASLTTAQGSNKDLKFTSLVLGTGGNSITIAYVVSGTNTPLDVTVVSAAITVQIATNGSGVATSTASEILTAVNTDVNANVLVLTSLATGSTGVGVPAAMAATNLAGGGYASELTGTRVNNVLDEIGWPVADRDIDAGQVYVVASYFAANKNANGTDNGPGTALLSHLHDDVESSENGYLFQNGEGIMVFHDRLHRLTSTLSTTSQGTYGDDPDSDELEYVALTPEFEKTHIYNSVAVSPFTGDPQVSQDATSMSRYMQRWVSISTHLTTTGDASVLAQYVLNNYKDPALRISSITIQPLGDYDLWQQAVQREIGDMITVKRRPPSLGATTDPMELNCYVEQIVWDISAGDGEGFVTFTLSNISTSTGLYFILDSTSKGVLDTNILFT